MADDIRIPSNLETLSALVGQTGLSYKIFESIIKVLVEHEKQLYACREDLKLARSTAVASERKCAEVLYKLGSIRQELKK